MWIVAVVLCAGGAVALFFVSKNQRAKAYDMQSTETSKAAELETLAKDITKEIGSGSFARQVELKGKIECATPLTAEMSGAACVHFRSTVHREYEETYTETDKDGHKRTGTRRGSEQVSSNERFTRFALRDDSGTVEVDPTGAALDEEKIFSRFEAAQSQTGSISFGSFRLDLGMFAGLGSGRRTIGYKLEEWALPLGKQVYLLGEASDSEGHVVVRKPTEKGKRFILSLKSEEEIVKSASGLATGLIIAAAVLAVGAIVLGLLGALGMLG